MYGNVAGLRWRWDEYNIYNKETNKELEVEFCALLRSRWTTTRMYARWFSQNQLKGYVKEICLLSYSRAMYKLRHTHRYTT